MSSAWLYAIPSALVMSLLFVLKCFLRWKHEYIISPSSTQYKPAGSMNLIGDAMYTTSGIVLELFLSSRVNSLE